MRYCISIKQILSLFSHPHVILSPYNWLSSIEHKMTNFEDFFFTKYIGTSAFKLQRTQKNHYSIIKVVHMISNLFQIFWSHAINLGHFLLKIILLWCVCVFLEAWKPWSWNTDLCRFGAVRINWFQETLCQGFWQ